MSEQEFTHALELYRTNLVQYRVTGRSEYKIAYENAERWIQLYLNGVTASIQDGKAFVDSFLENYSTANPDMESLRSRFQQIRREGPATEDDYTTLKRINDGNVVDTSTGTYVKAGVLAALVAAVFVVAAL